MKLDELKVYQISLEVGEQVWSQVNDWPYFEKDTIGKQLVRSADSIAANISEGYGRFHYKELRQYCYIARGSLFETKTWIQKASDRGLINTSASSQLQQKLDELGIKLNNFIRTIGNKGSNK